MQVRIERVGFWFILFAIFLGFRYAFILLGTIALAVLANYAYDFAVDIYSAHTTSIFAEHHPQIN